MRYLKNDYMFPIVEKGDFKANLGATYRRRSASPKLIIKGLTLLDGALDLEGSYVPGKSTLVVTSDDLPTLKFLAAVVNSRIASFYVKQKYASASYNGGVNFTPCMLNSIPIPNKINKRSLIGNVDRMLKAMDAIANATGVVHSAIKASGGSDKLGRKLDQWFRMASADFVAEIQRQGVVMTVKQKAEWVEFFDEKTESIAKSIVTVDSADREINDALCNAFCISSEEKATILNS